MFFASSKPAGVVCDGLTALVVDSGVPVGSLPYRIFMFPILALPYGTRHLNLN